MGLFNLFRAKPKNRISSSGGIVTKNGYTYKSVGEEEIPKWVWNKFMKMEKRGATTGSFKGKKYRYIVKYVGGGMYDCWKRKRGKL